MAQIRRITSLPVGVGFGVKDAETARTVAQIGDAVVVGSALIGKIEAKLDDPQAARGDILMLLRSMREAMDE
jgi:tryptophan synthase alpha chain